MARKITVYTSEGCPYCVQAKRLLKERGVPFQEILLGWDDDAGWDNLTQRSGMKTVPQIFADDSLIGGYQELAAMDNQDALASLK
jgi:glutaredoxin 3